MALVIGDLGRPVVGEQPRDGRCPFGEAARRLARDDGVELARRQQAVDRLRRADLLEVEIGRQIDGDALAPARALEAAGPPAHRARLDAVRVTQEAADPQRHGLLVFAETDRLALEIGRAFDAAVGADVDRRMPERPRQEHRHRDVGAVAARGGDHMARHRQLGDLELPVAQGAAEDVVRLARQRDEPATGYRDAAVEDRTAAVGHRAGERQRDVGHRIVSTRRGCGRAGRLGRDHTQASTHGNASRLALTLRGFRGASPARANAPRPPRGRLGLPRGPPRRSRRRPGRGHTGSDR